jgi:nucleoside-diphosphate-sugar epimerase
MTTVCILGANGQVGSEVALLLRHWPGIRVVAICRNSVGSSFIRRCGVECRHGHLDGSEQAATLLREVDLVVDFIIPRGYPSAIRAASTALISNVMAGAPAHAKYVFMSSLAAFGMPKGDSVALRRYLLSHTVYSATKRHAEKLVRRLGQRHGRDVYILRLGQVHGEIQGISAFLVEQARRAVPVAVPRGPSYAVFSYTIAEAIAAIAAGKEIPGTYTLVAVPQWSWEEVFAYYCLRGGVSPDISIEAIRSPDPYGLALAKSLTRSAKNALKGLALRHSELFAGSVVVHMPRLESRLLGLYMNETKGSTLSSVPDGRERPFAGAWVGEQIPGPFLRSLSDSRATMYPALEQVRRTLDRAAHVD